MTKEEGVILQRVEGKIDSLHDAFAEYRVVNEGRLTAIETRCVGLCGARAGFFRWFMAFIVGIVSAAVGAALTVVRFMSQEGSG